MKATNKNKKNTGKRVKYDLEHTSVIEEDVTSTYNTHDRELSGDDRDMMKMFREDIYRLVDAHAQANTVAFASIHGELKEIKGVLSNQYGTLQKVSDDLKLRTWMKGIAKAGIYLTIGLLGAFHAPDWIHKILGISSK